MNRVLTVAVVPLLAMTATPLLARSDDLFLTPMVNEWDLTNVVPRGQNPAEIKGVERSKGSGVFESKTPDPFDFPRPL